MNSNVFIYWWSDWNTQFLASKDQTSNFEPNMAFTRFTKLLIELTGTSFFWLQTLINHRPIWKSVIFSNCQATSFCRFVHCASFFHLFENRSQLWKVIFEINICKCSSSRIDTCKYYKHSAFVMSHLYPFINCNPRCTRTLLRQKSKRELWNRGQMLLR